MNNLWIYLILIGIILGGNYAYHSKVTSLTKANEVLVGNNKAFELELQGLQDSVFGLNSSRITYQLTIAELQKSNDATIAKLRQATKDLGIKDKELTELRHFKATVKTDTTITIIKNDSCEFEASIVYNPQTIFNISSVREDGVDTLKHSASISASFSNIEYTDSEWKEPKWYKRLFLFKWGKYHYTKNELISDNEMIQIKDFKVIKIIN